MKNFPWLRHRFSLAAGLAAAAAGLALLIPPAQPVPWEERVTDPAANEWRHVNADAAHSRYVSETVRPPLKLEWVSEALPHPYSAGRWRAVAVGDVIVANIQGYDEDRHWESITWALDARDGTTAWKREDRRRSQPAHLLSPVMPVVGDRIVVLPIGERLLGVHPATGEVAWERPALGDEVRALALASTGLLAVVGPAPPRSTRPSRLLALDLETGELQWDHPLDFGHWTVAEEAGRTVYRFHPQRIGELPGLNGTIFLQQQPWRTLVVFDTATRRAIGLRYFDWEAVSGAVAGGEHLYWVSDRTSRDEPLDGPAWAWAMDREARVDWARPLPDGPARALHAGVGVVTPRFAIAVGFGRQLWALDRQTGELAWQLELSERIGLSFPVVTGEVLYTARRTGPTRAERRDLVAVEVASGREVWATDVEGYVLEDLFAHRGAVYAVAVPAGQWTRHVVLKFAPE